MNMPLTKPALDQLFTNARTYPDWSNKQVDDALLRQLYDLAKWGPTSMNIQPMRVVFVKSGDEKNRLVTAVASGNVAKVEAAPVTAVIAQDMAFFEHLDRMAPHMNNPSDIFRGKEQAISSNAARNGTLQGAYLLIAARALGLDTGPMSGFDQEKMDALYFSNSSYRTNFIMNIGYGKPDSVHPRAPRFTFDEVCQIV